MVHRKPTGHSNHQSRGLACIDADSVIVNRIGMKSVRHGHFKLGDFLRAAFAHRPGLILKAFALDPLTRLENGHNLRLVLLRKGEQVSQMVGMRVRKKNHVQLRNFLQVVRTLWIAHDPRINQSHLARSSGQRKRAVAEIGHAVALLIEHGTPLENLLDWLEFPAGTLWRQRAALSRSEEHTSEL